MELLKYLHYYINGENPLIILRTDFMTGEDEPRRLFAGIDWMCEQVILTDLEGGINDNVDFKDIHLLKPQFRRIDSLTGMENIQLASNGGMILDNGTPWGAPTSLLYLLSIKIDIFGLIDAGLAIDANTPHVITASHDPSVNATIIDKG